MQWRALRRRRWAPLCRIQTKRGAQLVPWMYTRTATCELCSRPRAPAPFLSWWRLLRRYASHTGLEQLIDDDEGALRRLLRRSPLLLSRTHLSRREACCVYRRTDLGHARPSSSGLAASARTAPARRSSRCAGSRRMAQCCSRRSAGTTLSPSARRHCMRLRVEAKTYRSLLVYNRPQLARYAVGVHV